MGLVLVGRGWKGGRGDENIQMERGEGVRTGGNKLERKC
jgi:hypothetical protein